MNIETKNKIKEKLNLAAILTFETFSGLRLSFILKSYIIGYLVFIFYQKGNINSIYGIIALILFPFTNFVFESIISAFFGGILFRVGPVFLMLVLVRYMISFVVSPIVAPLGIFYILYKKDYKIHIR